MPTSERDLLPLSVSLWLRPTYAEEYCDLKLSRHVLNVARLPVLSDTDLRLTQTNFSTTHQNIQSTLKQVLLLGPTFAFPRLQRQNGQFPRMPAKCKRDDVIQLIFVYPRRPIAHALQ
jgi:hypothetical protein